MHAVELEYNELSGEWWRYYDPQAQANQAYLDHDGGPLTESSGKAALIEKVAQNRPGKRLMVGDGMSDLATQPAVDLFVGFGGVVARQKVEQGSPVFINANSLAPVLPLAAGPAAYESLAGTDYQATFERGLEMMSANGASFGQPDLRQTFEEAFRHVR